MPISSSADKTPAWIKGDLPADESDAAAQPADSPADQAAVTPDPPQLALEPIAVEVEQPVEPERPTPVEAFPLAAGGVEAAAAAEEQPAPKSDSAGMVAASERAPAEPAHPQPAAPEVPAVEELSLEAQLESLLFVADGAVTVARLAEALETSSREVESALTALGQGYRQRGLSLQRFRDKVQLTTSPSAAARVERFLGLAAASPLSRAALETLAIVAYQQPVTRPQIEAVRGVNSDSVIKNLLSKGLIEESGRAEGPGRPVLYITTPEFMQHFGLASLGDLPPLALSSTEAAASPEGILKG